MSAAERITHLGNKIEEYHKSEDLDADLKNEVKAKLNDLFGKEELAYKAATGGVKQLPSLERKEEKVDSPQTTIEESQAALREIKERDQADIKERNQGKIDERFDRTKEAVESYLKAGNLPANTPSAEEKYLQEKVKEILERDDLDKEFSARLEEIERDPKTKNLAPQEQEHLAAKDIELPVGLDNKIKDAVVAWGKKLSPQQREEKALTHRQKTRAKTLSEKQAQEERLPEGAAVKEDGNDVLVKPLAEAEDADDVARFFRHKYEGHPSYKDAFKRLITDRAVKSTNNKLPSLISGADARIEAAKEGLITKKANIELKEQEMAKLEGKTDKASKDAYSSAKSSRSASLRHMKGNQEKLEYNKVIRERLGNLKPGKDLVIGAGKWSVDKDGKVTLTNRTINQQIKNVVSGMFAHDLPAEMFLINQLGTDEEWKPFEKLLGDLDTSEVSKLSPKQRESMLKKLSDAHRGISSDIEWRRGFRDEKKRNAAIKFLNELHQSWPSKLSRKDVDLVPKIPEEGFYSADQDKEASEDIKDLYETLKDRKEYDSADKLEGDIKNKLLRNMPNDLGEEPFTDWYKRITSVGDEAKRLPEESFTDWKERIGEGGDEVKRLPGVAAHISSLSPEYKEKAGDLYNHYLVGAGKTDPNFRVKRLNVEQAKEEFIEDMRKTLRPQFVSDDKLTPTGKKVLSDKYLGNLFDKYSADKIKNIEGQHTVDVGKQVEKQKRSIGKEDTVKELKANKKKSAAAIDKFGSGKNIEKKLTQLKEWHNHPGDDDWGTFTATVSPGKRPPELELFPSATNEKRYKNAVEESELDDGKPVQVTFDLNSYHRENIAKVLWDQVNKLQEAGNDKWQDLQTDLEAGGVAEPYMSRMRRESELGEAYVKKDSLEAKARAFGAGGTYRDAYFDEGTGKTKWKEFETQGINPLVDKISEKYGVPAKTIRSILPDHEDPSFSRDQHRHLVNELSGIVDQHSGKNKTKTLAGYLARALQKHRDGFHPYTIMSLLDVGGAESPKQFPHLALTKIIPEEKRYEAALDKLAEVRYFFS